MTEIVIGHRIIPQIGETLHRAGLRGRAFVFSTESVARHHGQATLDGLRAGGWEARLCVYPDGEPTKSLAQAFRAYDWLVEQRAERRDTIIALGGGVIGDLAGFVAATYLRGLAFVQAPTTLLAQVDSAIGGKTGVNHPRGKNLVGAFHMARVVFGDTATLATLPKREIPNGWVEAIKHGLIRDPDLLARIEANVDGMLALEPAITVEVVRRAAQVKVDVVAEDPHETGLRMILNYGHTIGHAIEAAAHYDGILHGEAVAIGLRGAAQIAVALGILSPVVAERQAAVLERFGLPQRVRELLPHGVDPDAVLAAMKFDKKVETATNRWVLLEDIGRTRITTEVPANLVREVVAGLM